MTDKPFIYADHAASAPVSKGALEAMMPWLTGQWGNPSSVHSAGMRAGRAVLEAREKLAGVLGAKRPSEIYFTSGGTESDNWAIRGAAELGAARGKRHIITTAMEHPAVLNTCRYLEGLGFRVTYLRPDGQGLVTAGQVEEALGPETCLVSVMAANNEVGTIQPIGEIGALCRERGVVFHTDGVQAVGQMRFDVNELGADLVSVSGHKLGGPKGIGALYCRGDIQLPTLIFGGGQERGRRAGTENVPGIVGMAAAAEECLSDLEERSGRLRELRDWLAGELLNIPGSRVNGSMVQRLPGNLNMSFEGIEGEAMLMMLSMEGVCASSGSACSAGSLEPSHVLRAMGISDKLAKGSLRLTFGRGNTLEDARYIAGVLPGIIERLRQLTPR